MQVELELQIPQWMVRVCQYLKTNEESSWQWFSSVEAQSDYADTLRMELLKSTYRLSSEDHLELYEAAQQVIDKLSLEIPFTLYQSQSPGNPSAAIYYLPGEAHIVFFGNLLDLLTLPEQKSIIAHELSHYKLWQENNGEYLIGDRFLDATVGHPQVENSQLETARRYRLYTEIYADRGSLFVMENLEVVVSALIKVHTGMKQISAMSYLEQANEIFAQEEAQTEGLSHPEAFIRARALQLFMNSPEKLDSEIDKMILGQLSIDKLDLLQQTELTRLTTAFVKEIIEPEWLQDKELFMNRLALYNDTELICDNKLNLGDFLSPDLAKSIKEYFSFLLLDFVALDREILPALALRCDEMAQKYHLQDTYELKLIKELKIKKTEWKNWLKNKDKIMAEINTGGVQ